MHFRKFGNTDLSVSEIGFGAWAIGGGAMIGSTSIGWGDVDDTQSHKAILKALDCGINFFDTADIYGLGHSEKIIGRTIGNNPNVIIATKVGNVARDDRFTVDYSREYILKAVDESLRRLQRETIDYYQLHSARLEHLQQGECIDAMQHLQKLGKIRYWGLSLNSFDPFPEANFLTDAQLGSGFQLVLNILNQKALALVQPATGYGIIARMPLQFGLLTGKFDSDAGFASNDHRKNRLTKEVIDAARAALEPIWNLCDKYGITKTQLALSYVLSYPVVATVIPGIRTAEQVAQNTTGIISLEPKDVAMIEAAGQHELKGVMQLIEQRG